MKKLFIALSIIVFAVGCSGDGDGGDGNTTDTFDRAAMLTNWADNIIIPAYNNYQAKVNALSASASDFNAEPTEANLVTLRESWLQAYKAYQHVAMFEIGKADELKLLSYANTYPADAAHINSNIANGTYNLSLYDEFPSQGFPGLDYILNGLANNDADIVAFYSTNTNAAHYKQYLTDLTTRLKTVADAVLTDWTSGYRDTFIAGTGTSVNSAVNVMTNNFVKHLEKDVRTPKIDIPAGVLSNGLTYPDKVEAYYKNNVSKELLNEAITASKNFFNGKHFTSETTGPSLKNYLDAVNAVRDGQKLSDIINNQYTTVLNTIGALNNSFSQQITTDNTKMVAAHDALQKNVVYIKNDMLQAINMQPDYVDGDGD